MKHRSTAAVLIIFTTFWLIGSASAAPTTTIVQNLVITGLKGSATSSVVISANGTLATGTTGASVSGTPNYVPAFNASGTGLSSTSLYYQSSNGNVGIGTQSPSYALDVAGIIQVQKGSSEHFILGDTGGQPRLQHGVDRFTFLNQSDGQLMNIYDTGYVTIGTPNTPVAPLDIVAPFANNGIFLSLGRNGGQDVFDFFSDTSSNNWIRSGFGDIVFATNGGTAASGAVERMRILTNGNVGIGTPTPDASLSVLNGGIDIQNTNATGFATVFVKTSGGTVIGDFGYSNSSASLFPGLVHATTLGNNPYIIGTNGIERVRVEGNGNFDIGSASIFQVDTSGVIHQGTLQTGNVLFPGGGYDGLDITNGTRGVERIYGDASHGSSLEFYAGFTNSSNYSRMRWDANTIFPNQYTFVDEALGTGSTLPIVFRMGTTNALTIATSGYVTANQSLSVSGASSTLKIGTGGTNPGCIEMYDSVNSSTLEYMYFASGSIVATSTKPTFCQ